MWANLDLQSPVLSHLSGTDRKGQRECQPLAEIHRYKKKDEKSESPHWTKSTVSLKRVPINLTLQQDKSYKEQSMSGSRIKLWTQKPQLCSIKSSKCVCLPLVDVSHHMNWRFHPSKQGTFSQSCVRPAQSVQRQFPIRKFTALLSLPRGKVVWVQLSFYLTTFYHDLKFRSIGYWSFYIIF